MAKGKGAVAAEAPAGERAFGYGQSEAHRRFREDPAARLLMLCAMEADPQGDRFGARERRERWHEMGEAGLWLSLGMPAFRGLRGSGEWDFPWESGGAPEDSAGELGRIEAGAGLEKGRLERALKAALEARERHAPEKRVRQWPEPSERDRKRDDEQARRLAKRAQSELGEEDRSALEAAKRSWAREMERAFACEGGGEGEVEEELRRGREALARECGLSAEEIERLEGDERLCGLLGKAAFGGVRELDAALFGRESGRESPGWEDLAREAGMAREARAFAGEREPGDGAWGLRAVEALWWGLSAPERGERARAALEGMAGGEADWEGVGGEGDIGTAETRAQGTRRRGGGLRVALRGLRRVMNWRSPKLLGQGDAPRSSGASLYRAAPGKRTLDLLSEEASAHAKWGRESFALALEETGRDPEGRSAVASALAQRVGRGFARLREGVPDEELLPGLEEAREQLEQARGEPREEEAKWKAGEASVKGDPMGRLAVSALKALRKDLPAAQAVGEAKEHLASTGVLSAGGWRALAGMEGCRRLLEDSLRKAAAAERRARGAGKAKGG